jgi:hypothetical protein
MKKNILLLFLCIANCVLNAQEVALLPYIENFDPPIVHQIPEGTYRETITGNSWVAAPVTTGTYSGNVLKYTPTYEAANAWFFSKPVYLAFGHCYTIEYLYGNSSPKTSEKFKVSLCSKPAPSGAIMLVAQHKNVKGAYLNIETSSGIFAPISGIYYIGIKAESEAYQGELYVDELRVWE